MPPYKITPDPDYVAPEGPIETNEAYLNFVMQPVFQSYLMQYPEAGTLDGAITAARERRNADLPPPPEAPAGDETEG